VCVVRGSLACLDFGGNNFFSWIADLDLVHTIVSGEDRARARVRACVPVEWIIWFMYVILALYRSGVEDAEFQPSKHDKDHDHDLLY